jgi:hypothetical protein
MSLLQINLVERILPGSEKPPIKARFDRNGGEQKGKDWNAQLKLGFLFLI